MTSLADSKDLFGIIGMEGIIILLPPFNLQQALMLSMGSFPLMILSISPISIRLFEMLLFCGRSSTAMSTRS